MSTKANAHSTQTTYYYRLEARTTHNDTQVQSIYSQYETKAAGLKYNQGNIVQYSSVKLELNWTGQTRQFLEKSENIKPETGIITSSFLILATIINNSDIHYILPSRLSSKQNII